MIVRPYWITPQLAIVPRPEGGHRLDDEMSALHKAGIDVVISMLESEEAAELGLRGEENAAVHAGVSFINFPVPDHGVPRDLESFVRFLSELETKLAVGRRVGIHCRGCIGRSSVVAVSLLIRSGVSPREAWAQVSIARGYPVPHTNEQRSWVNLNIKASPL